MRRASGILLLVALSLASMPRVSAQAEQRDWVRLYNGSAGGGDEALVVTTTSKGGRILVAGLEAHTDFSRSVRVIAYRYDGTVAWRASYTDPAPFEVIYVEDIAVSKDDREVILTASLIGVDRDPFAVVGFDASSGALDWSWLSAPVTASPRDLATATGRIFVVGTAGGFDMDRFIVALEPLSGDVLWTVRWDAPQGDATADSALVRDGRLFVTGSVATKDAPALRTVAYRATDGSLDWQATSWGTRAGSVIGIAGGGSMVLVQTGWRLIGYDMESGARASAGRLDPAWRGMIRDVTTDAAGTKVFFTGNDERVGSSHSDMVTAAYDVGSHRRLWLARFDGDAYDEGADIVWVRSEPPTVVVTGGSEHESVFGWRTIAYRAGTGVRLWSDLYRGPLQQQGFPRAIAASPGGRRVYVVGYTTTSRHDDFATVAYRTT